ncbi:hypothetical protein HPB49_025872 [Dermacentor silvarum]|nr:hypothetical protein HPB49_025872 [Dermacentor silvarum]
MPCHSPIMFFQIVLLAVNSSLSAVASTLPPVYPADAAAAFPTEDGLSRIPPLDEPPLQVMTRFFVWQRATLSADPEPLKRGDSSGDTGHGIADSMPCHSPIMFFQNDLQALTKRVEELESKSQAIASPGASTSFQPDISKMQEKIDDLENRSRRSNVLFYGISDSNKSEAWDVYKRLAREFCPNKLGISVSTIARAHRIGRFSPVKPRPIIAKLFNEKEVETVMANGFKLKNTTFSVSRDYSEAVRDIRQLSRRWSSTRSEPEPDRRSSGLLGYLMPFYLCPVLYPGTKVGCVVKAKVGPRTVRVHANPKEQLATTQESKCFYCVLVMMSWWLLRAMPKPVLAFLPAIALPLLGIMGHEQIASNYLSVRVILFNGDIPKGKH